MPPISLPAMTRRSRACALLLLCAAFWLRAGAALGQSATDRATAEILFNEALALLANQEPGEACKKLEESQRLDPGTGTLLYLADCYQQMGRTASAWATFREAAYAAKSNSDEREATALEHAALLEPKLSYLTIEVTPQRGGAVPEIKHDGSVVNSAVWGTAFPVDPGAHLIEAAAPGKKPWSQTVNVAEGPRQQRVVVPELEPALPEPRPIVAAPPPSAAPPPPAAKGTQKIVGWVLVGVGSAGVITGGVLALSARGDDSDADAVCRPDRSSLCGPAGVELGERAANKATWAGVSAGAGLAALGAGVTLLLLAPPSDAGDAGASAHAGEIGLSLGTAGAKLSFRSAF